MAAHAGRKTVMVRDFDVTRNVLLTIHSGSSGTPGFLTEEETRRKVERLQESVQARIRKGGRGGDEGGGGPSNGGEGDGVGERRVGGGVNAEE